MNSQDEQLSDEQLSEVGKVFQSLPEKFRSGQTDRPLTYYFSIDGEQWTVIAGPELCEVNRGKFTDKADCFLKTSKEIFLGTIRGSYTPSIMDIVSGKVKINDPTLLMTFQKVFGSS